MLTFAHSDDSLHSFRYCTDDHSTGTNADDDDYTYVCWARTMNYDAGETPSDWTYEKDCSTSV